MGQRSEEIRFEFGDKRVFATQVVTTDRFGRETLQIGRDVIELARDDEQHLFVRFEDTPRSAANAGDRVATATSGATRHHAA